MNARVVKISLILLTVCYGIFLNTSYNKAYAGVCQAENCNKPASASSGSHCGDGICSSSLGETMTSCVADCGMPPVTCGDNVCSYNSGENCNSCAKDCGACATPTRTPTPTPTRTPTPTPTPRNCGDGVCSYNSGESCSTCPNDCMCMTTTTVRPTTTTIRQTTTTVRPTTTTTTVPANVCKAYTVQHIYEGRHGGGWMVIENNLPPCLSGILNHAKNYCNQVMGNHKDRDACYWQQVSYTFWLTGGDSYGMWYFTVDSNGRCNSSGQRPTSGKICKAGEVHWLGSPISLLLNTGYEDFQKESRIVNFALAPDGKDFAAWKGSAEAPLLVLDPEHKGQITSAEQLFGNWTFGGKKQASLTSSNKTSSAWENGYEALGTMDANNDGVVSGEELSSLALWFDENRNAKSEVGEVKSLAEVGIKTLYYKGYRKDAISEDLIVSVGYEREVSGMLEKGISVDWYGVTGNSEMEVVQKQLAKERMCSRGENFLKTDVADQMKEGTEHGSLSEVEEEGYLGQWIWNSDSKDVKTGGLLLFARDGESKIKGMSLVELLMENDSSSVNEEKAISQLAFEGKIVTDEVTKEKVLLFTFQGQDGTVLESRAELSEDKLVLKGETKAYVVNGPERITKAQYSWSAVRYQEK